MIRKLAVALSICAFALPVLWGTAQARSVPFLSGHTTDANRLTCVAMEQFKGTVFNLVGPFSLDNSQCGQGLIYELPLTVDNGGSKNVTFTVKGFGSPRCRAIATARDLSVQSVSSFVAPDVLQTYRNVAIPAVNAPTSGYLYLDCDMTSGDTYSVANYNP